MKTNFKSAHDQFAHFKSLAKKATGPYSAEKKVYGMPLTDLVAIGLQVSMECLAITKRKAQFESSLNIKR